MECVEVAFHDKLEMTWIRFLPNIGDIIVLHLRKNKKVRGKVKCIEHVLSYVRDEEPDIIIHLDVLEIEN